MKKLVTQMPKFLERSFGVLAKKLSLFALSTLLGVSTTVAQDGGAIFKQSCGMCHSVGKGRLVGPDIKGVNTKRNEEWIIKFVKGSQAFIKSGDADAKAIFDEYQVVMPDQNLTDAEIKSIITFIAANSEEKPAIAADEKAPIALTGELAVKGQHYFDGSLRLSNGGAACISCHNVNYDGVIPGGLLAKDLTNVYTRLGGEDGIKGLLGAPPFPAMTVAYKNHPMTEEEIVALAGFLTIVDKDKAHQHPKSTVDMLLYGFVGLFVILALIFILWRNKKSGMVKQDIYDRQIETFK